MNVTFTDLSTNGPTSWNWTFGDGNFSSLQNPSHIYFTAGLYNVTLNATNSAGSTVLTKVSYIHVSSTVATASKIGIFRPSTLQFILDYNGNGTYDGPVVDRLYTFGQTGKPVSGDWNLDGRSEIGVYNNVTHIFRLDYNGNGLWDGTVIDRQYSFGAAGDIGVSGDWNLDGKSEIGVFRPSMLKFYMDYNGNGIWDGPVIDKQSSTFGASGDLPVTGDWNLDGRTEIGVFRSTTHTFYLDYNGNGLWNGAVTDRQYTFGANGDLPVSGDWNLDGRTEIGVFRPSTHVFYLDYNGNGVFDGSLIDRQYTFGATGDLPITGKWS